MELIPLFLTLLIVWILFFAVTLYGYRIGKRIPTLRRAILRLGLISSSPLLLLVVLVAGLLTKLASPPRSAPAANVETLPSRVEDLSPREAEREWGRVKTPDERLQDAVNALPVGDVLFHHSEQMQLRKQETVQVRISEDLTQDLARGLSAQGTERDQIKVSTSMKVRLSGDPYFDIRPLNNEEQLVTRNGYTEWAFTVLPLKNGRWPLHLVITAVIRTPWGTEKNKDYPVKDEFVQVRVTTLAAIEYFLQDNWQWFASAIVIPLAIWGVKKRVEARKKKVASLKEIPTAAPVAISAQEDSPAESKETKSSAAAQKSA